MTNLMRASEARIISESFIDTRSQKVLTEIMSNIAVAAACGDRTYYYYDVIPPQVLTKLRDLGYKVEYISHYSDTTYTISW